MGKNNRLKLKKNNGAIDKLIDEAIDGLSDDNIKIGADALAQLATLWSKAGLTLNSFLDIRQYIINEATQKTSALFINEKLKIAEKTLRESRTGTIIITH